MNIHLISVLNPNFASRSVRGFLRLDAYPPAVLGLDARAESSPIALDSPTTHLTGTELSGTATVIASVPLLSLAGYGFILPSA